jgi:hypothetical protein
MVPISDGNLLPEMLPEIAQAAEGLEFVDGHAFPSSLGKVKKARVNRIFSSSWPSREQTA